MDFKKIWVGTSKSANLHRIYMLQTGNPEREAIYECVEEDLKIKKEQESSLEQLNGNALIDDIPYYVDFTGINEGSYLFPFKEKVEIILSANSPSVIQFSKNPLKSGEIKNFEENEGVKFIAAQTDHEIYFMYISNNSVIKNRVVMNFDINEHSTVLSIPKGIQIPPAVTARIDTATKRLYVYDVNKFESMLTVNENKKAKSQATLNKFISGEYKISAENYSFMGLDNPSVQQNLKMSSRAVRRLAKYQQPQTPYSISQIKEAVGKLEAHLQVEFDDVNKTIIVNQQTAKTFVGIIHNGIVMRLISKEVEIAI